MTLDAHLDLEWKRLIVGTNDQRRRVGQAAYHLYRTLAFWHDKGRAFFDVTRAWSVGGAAIFDALAATLRELEVFQEDTPLRAWQADVLAVLADDLERGDAMLWPFLRWLEGRLPALTRMMQAEASGSRVYDFELARRLTHTFTVGAGADRSGLVEVLRTTARAITPAAGARRASPRG